MTPSKRKPTAKPEPMSPKDVEYFREKQRQAKQKADNEAAGQHFKDPDPEMPKKAKGGMVKKYVNGGVTRADGCITKGPTKGRMV
jgi:hypothetical protein